VLALVHHAPYDGDGVGLGARDRRLPGGVEEVVHAGHAGLPQAVIVDAAGQVPGGGRGEEGGHRAHVLDRGKLVGRPPGGGRLEKLVESDGHVRAAFPERPGAAPGDRMRVGHADDEGPLPVE
jgi:hypothetical protein